MTWQMIFLLALSFTAVKRHLVSQNRKDGCYLVWVLINKHQGMGGSGQISNHEKQTSCLSAENVLFLKNPLELKILPNLNSN